MTLNFTTSELSPQVKALIGLAVLNCCYTLDFAEGDKIPVTDAASLLTLKQVLEETYLDGITAIKEVYLEGSSFTGIFEDKVSEKLTKRNRFTVSEDEVSYKLENPEDVTNFSEELVEFAAKGAKNCIKGQSCGGSCISKSKECKKLPSAGAKKKVADLKKKVSGGSEGSEKSATESKKPTPESKKSTTESAAPKKPKTQEAAEAKVKKAQEAQEAKAREKKEATERMARTKEEVKEERISTIKAKKTKEEIEIKKVTENLQETPKSGVGAPVIDRYSLDSILVGGKYHTDKYLQEGQQKLTAIQERLNSARENLAKKKGEGKISPETLKEFNQTQGEYFKVKEDISNSAFTNLLKDLYHTSGKTQADAEEWFKGVYIQDSFKQFQKKNAEVAASTIEAFKHVYMLTGGKYLETFNHIEKTDDRASVDWGRGNVNVGKGTRQEVFHEMGHHLEQGYKANVQSRDWLDKKATSQQPQSLNSLTGSSTYGEGEIALPGRFYTPYVGRIYGARGAPTEVVAMGLDHFTDAKKAQQLYELDPDHFHYIVGLLKT